MRKYHHLFFGGFPYPHGMAGTQIVQSYLPEFHRRGDITSVLALRRSLDPDDALRGTYQASPYLVAESGLFIGRGAWAARREAMRFIERQFKPGYTNIAVHYGVPHPRNIPYLYAARRLGYRLLHWVVEDYSALSLYRAWKRRALPSTVAARVFDGLIPLLSDGVVVLSSRLENKYAGRAKSVRRIPISVAAARLPRPMRSASAQTFLYAGSFGDKDGVEDLIHAFQRSQAMGMNGRLVLMGGGPYSVHYVQKYGQHEDIEFTGYVPDSEFKRRLCEADVLCMTRIDDPYAHAGFPYKLGEYLAAGRAIIATDVSDIRSYMRHEEHALLVGPGDVEGIAEAMLRLSGDADLARALGERGRALFEQTFSSRVCADLWRSYLDELCEGTSHDSGALDGK